MDPKVFGATIAALRKKKGYTQASLAEKLNCSDKTVSKWESGTGCPDIMLLPALAKLLGVTVDQLFSEKNKGIVVAGNFVVDIVKNIDVYPAPGMLTDIRSLSLAIGGCAPNTATDLAKLDRTLPVSVLGRVGDDEYGRFLISKLQTQGINVAGVCVSTKQQTAFSDVMSLPSGERTFFSCRGANAEFSPCDVDITTLNCKILHIGYILLLDKFDEEDEEYGTVMARFLHSLQERGIRTSIDAVSDSSGRFAEKIVPALLYADYVIINEIECCSIWGIEPRSADGSLDVAAVRIAMEKTMAAGVGQKVIVHAKEAGFCLNADGEFTKVGSLKLPVGLIKGSVGAGDAFCAGCLYGIYHEFSDKEMLEFASATAAQSLFSENSVDGMRSKKEIYRLAEQYERRSI